jgi:hypothetical protein
MILEKGYLAIRNVDSEHELLDPERRRVLVEAGIHSFQGAVLQIGDERLGVLFVDYDHHREFNEAARRVLQGFAPQAARALKTVQLLRSVHDAQRTMEAFVAPFVAPLSLERALGGLSLERALEGIAELAKDVLECDVVTLHVYNASTDTFERPPRHAGNLVDPEAARRDPDEDPRLVRWVMVQSGPELVDVKHEPSFPGIAPAGCRSDGRCAVRELP